MTDIEPRQIEWGSAQIKDATLTVELTGPDSKAWRTHFEHVLALLDKPHRGWGEIHLIKTGIKIADLQQGSESEVRHLLESIVLQANSNTAPDAPQHDGSRGDDGPDADEQMAATFRRFAAEHQ